MAKRKPKSRQKPRGTMPGRNGGRLNVGGDHGGGRPPDEFRARLRAMVSREDRMVVVETVLRDKKSPHWINAWKYATEHGYGKPPQPVTLATEEGRPLEIAITRRIVGP